MSMMIAPSRFGVGAYDPGYSAHRYWRLRALTANGNPVGLAELEMHSSVGGSQLCTGGTAISRADFDGTYPKTNAFDGNRTDGHDWVAPGSTAGVEWIGYDFGAGNDKKIVEISYTARANFGSQSMRYAALEYSDDATTWTLAFNMYFGNFANGEIKVRAAQAALPTGAQPHIYWRITFDDATSSSASGRDGEIHLTPGGVDVTEDNLIVYTDNAHFSNWSFDRLFDNDLGTLVAINSPGYGQMQFATPVTIEEFKWRARDGNGANYQIPLRGAVRYSDDGTTWTDYWYYETPTWADDETKTISNPGPSAPNYHRAIGRGNRSAVITVTATGITASGGAVANLVDGSYGDSFFWNSGTGTGAAYLTFAFLDKYAVDQISWYQSSATAQGVWRLEGSNDNSTFTQVGADFTLNTGIFDFANTTPYQYYRMRHMSGSRSNSFYQKEIEFRAGPPS